MPVGFVRSRGILSRFLLPVFSYEAFPCRLPCWRILPFPRTLLHDLLPLVHPEVVPVFLQLSAQGLYWYNQFCFHFFSLYNG